MMLLFKKNGLVTVIKTMLRTTAKSRDNSVLNEELNTVIQKSKALIEGLEGALLNGTKNRKRKVDFEIIRNLYEVLEVEAVY